MVPAIEISGHALFRRATLALLDLPNAVHMRDVGALCLAESDGNWNGHRRNSSSSPDSGVFSRFRCRRPQRAQPLTSWWKLPSTTRGLRLQGRVRPENPVPKSIQWEEAGGESALTHLVLRSPALQDHQGLSSARL